MKKNYYGSLASKVYDLTKPPGTSIDGDLEFYINNIMPLDGKILEAGVGNGRMLIPMLRKGIDIVGLDISQEMLNLTQHNLNLYNLETNLIHDDLISFKSNYKYEAIIMPNGSFCLIDDKDAALAILKNFKSQLTNTGKIYLDLIYPISFKAGEKHTFDYNFENESTISLENYAKEINWFEQMTYSQITYKQDTHIEEQEFNLRWYGVDEFKTILTSVGYTDIQVIKNYGQKRMLNLKTVTFIAK